MLVKIELTDYHIKWMQENYGKVSRKECAEHLKVSVTTIGRWVKELGLQMRPSEYKAGVKKKKLSVEVVEDGEIGYCLDCKHYIFGGFCGKTNRHTGALNEKQCFKRNTQ